MHTYKKVAGYTCIYMLTPHCTLTLFIGIQSMRFMRCVTGRISNLIFKNSKYFHIAFHHSQGIIIDNLKIRAPCNSKNTDGVHLSGSSNMTLTNLDIGTGDDCISIGPGTYNVTITGCKCGPGHGFR